MARRKRKLSRKQLKQQRREAIAHKRKERNWKPRPASPVRHDDEVSEVTFDFDYVTPELWLWQTSHREVHGDHNLFLLNPSNANNLSYELIAVPPYGDKCLTLIWSDITSANFTPPDQIDTVTVSI